MNFETIEKKKNAQIKHEVKKHLLLLQPYVHSSGELDPSCVRQTKPD